MRNKVKPRAKNSVASAKSPGESGLRNRRITPILSGWMGGVWAVFMGSFMVKVTLAKFWKNEGVHLVENRRKAAQMEKAVYTRLRYRVVMDQMLLCPPPKIHMLKFSSQEEDIWMEWAIDHHGHEGGALMNGISAPTSHPERMLRGWLSAAWKRAQNPTSGDTLISDFQPLEMWKIHFFKFISSPIYGIWFQQPELRQECIVSTFWK